MANPALRLPSSRMPALPMSQSRTRAVVLVVLGVLVTLAGSAIIGMTNYGPYVVGGVVAAVGGMVVLLRPSMGLYFLFIFIYSNTSSVLEAQYGVPDLNKFLVVLIFIGTLASRVVLLKKPLIFRLSEIVIMLYGGAVIASLFLSPEEDHAIESIIDWLKDFVILLIIVQFGTEEHVWKRTQWLLIITAALLGVLNAVQMVTGDVENNFLGFANTAFAEVTEEYNSDRMTGPLDDPNFYGMVQLMVLPLAVYRFLTDPVARNRKWGLVASVFILIAIVSSYSRGAFLGLVVVAALIMRERRINPFAVVMVLALVAIAVVPFLPKGFVERMSSLSSLVSTDANDQTDGSLRGRSSEIIVALQMFRDYPVLGIGSGHYADNYLDYAATVGLDDRFEARAAHSLYLEIAAETGLFGLITFGFMIVVLFRGMRQATIMLGQINRHDLTYWVSGVRYALVAYLVPSIFLHGDYIRYFWLVVGLAASSSVLAQALRMHRGDPRIVSKISPIT